MAAVEMSGPGGRRGRETAVDAEAAVRAAPDRGRGSAAISPKQKPTVAKDSLAGPALELAMRWEDPGPVSVPPSSDVGERLAALAGQRPWWPLVEPTPRWIRVRIGDELVADSRRALLHVQYGRGALPRSFLPTYYVPVDDVRPAALADPVEAETGLTVWAVAAGGLRAEDAAWMHHRPPQPLEALAGLVTFSWRD